MVRFTAVCRLLCMATYVDSHHATTYHTLHNTRHLPFKRLSRSSSSSRSCSSSACSSLYRSIVWTSTKSASVPNRVGFTGSSAPMPIDVGGDAEWLLLAAGLLLWRPECTRSVFSRSGAGPSLGVARNVAQKTYMTSITGISRYNDTKSTGENFGMTDDHPWTVEYPGDG